MNEKISKIKLELLKEEFIKQIKDSYTLNLSMVLLEEFENLQQEYQQLQNNWNELREYILEDNWSSVNGEITSKLILRKMQEIEGGVDNE